MKTTDSNSTHREKPIAVANGWPRLFLNIAMVIGGPILWINGVVHLANREFNLGWLLFILGMPMMILGVIFLIGHFTLQPNEGRVLLLFGEYRGTVRESGFFWTNPFYTKRKVSLRTRNFNSDKLKVNDKRGNPVEIAAVVVWRVRDMAQAVFDVDDFESYVAVQAESAIRQLASQFAYDQGDGADEEITLRGGSDEVAAALTVQLQERLERAGVLVEEARIAHLAYAPEIAQAMLRRQQAEAVIAARQKIVHGAVSMVEMALRELAEKKVIVLDDERKAAMVSNLLVVLCGESEAQPVLNTGTLYQ
jgi:regulator of protease activity HflC (stomatin/prohibitin superfamily)